jgi:hypothetical protein
MNPLEQTQSTSVLLTCQACGRRMPYIPSNDAGQETAAPSTSCRSCGSEVVVPVALNSGGSREQPIDEAATARIQPQVLPDSGAVSPLLEASTAILAPPAQKRENAANPPVGATAPISEVDRYKTAAAVEPVAPPPPATWPVPEIGPPAKEPTSGRRNLWLLVGTSLVLAALFVGGILLALTGSQPQAPKNTSVTQPASTATATVPAGFVQRMDTAGLYSFAVPLSWVQQLHQGPANTEFTIYADPTQDTSFEVESFPTGIQVGGSTLDTRVLRQSFPSLRPTDVSPPSSVTLAHETWVVETAKLTLLTQNGGTLTQNLTVQTTTHNGTIFIIFYSSPSASTGGGDSQVVLQVLSTFTFLS